MCMKELSLDSRILNMIQSSTNISDECDPPLLLRRGCENIFFYNFHVVFFGYFKFYNFSQGILFCTFLNNLEYLRGLTPPASYSGRRLSCEFVAWVAVYRGSL